MISIIADRVPGKWAPRGMEPQRHSVDQYCSGNGEGSYDYMIGKFS